MADIKRTTSSSGGVPAWLAMLVVIVVVLIAWIVVVRTGKRGSVPAVTQPTMQTTTPSPRGAPTPGAPKVIPEIVNAYIGTIESVALERHEFTLSAKADRNNLLQDAKFTVRVGSATTLRERVVAETLPLAGGAQPAVASITFAALKAGDEVTVTSADNLRGLTAFTVDVVTRIVVK